MTIGAKKTTPTTGIGSLPHHNVDAALEFSFKLGIPFLPQIPIRNPWEYMIAQALEGLPGLQADSDGSVQLNTDIWISRAAAFSARLDHAFRSDEALEAFEPAPSISSCWQPFVWELEERQARIAKVQIAGPMTAQWALRLKDGQGQPVLQQAFIEKNPQLTTQIFRLVLARALAMSRRLKRAGIQPLLYLDEPGLYAYSPSNPRHVLAMQELRLGVQALAKEGVQVGIHCCSNTDWAAVLQLPIHYLSIDVGLSLPSLLKAHEAVARYVQAGGRFSLGVIPTGKPSTSGESNPLLRNPLGVTALYEGLIADLTQGLGKRPGGTELVKRILDEALFTPACGLAFQSAADAELILGSLSQFESRVRSSRGELHAAGTTAH